MERALLAARLADASRRAVEFARELVAEALPDAIRFCVELNASYDGHPLHAHEAVYPEDSNRHSAELERVGLDALVALLWRDGAVPEWVNLSVESADADATIVSVIACGRFTADEALLYHEHEGRPPFHVLGPSMPPDEMRDGERFSLWWSTDAGDRATLTRALDHAHNVRILVARGAWCDDDTLALVRRFPRMITLRLECTTVTGRGFPQLAGLGLQYASLGGVGARALDLAGLAGLTELRSVHVDGEPTALVGLDRLAGVKEVVLKIGALDSIAFVAGMPLLEWLGVSGSRVSSIEPLRDATHLRHLDLAGTRVTDAAAPALAALPSLRRLWLAQTQVSDAALDAFATARDLDRLDVRGTRVTHDGLARLADALPHLQLLADGWTRKRRRRGTPPQGEK